MTWLAPPKPLHPAHECPIPCEAGGLCRRPELSGCCDYWTRGAYVGGVWRCDECGQHWRPVYINRSETAWSRISARKARRIIRKEMP